MRSAPALAVVGATLLGAAPAFGQAATGGYGPSPTEVPSQFPTAEQILSEGSGRPPGATGQPATTGQAGQAGQPAAGGSGTTTGQSGAWRGSDGTPAASPSASPR
ncbi:MAG TPA: hypothetical protein VF406_01535 [Thermodesulfobacteriota bacterium]